MRPSSARGASYSPHRTRAAAGPQRQLCLYGSQSGQPAASNGFAVKVLLERESSVMKENKTVERKIFPPKLGIQVQSQFSHFRQIDMSAYTFERVKSTFYTAKKDLSVFDLEGTLVLRGRDFGDRIFFWQPLPTTVWSKPA